MCNMGLLLCCQTCFAKCIEYVNYIFTVMVPCLNFEGLQIPATTGGFGLFKLDRLGGFRVS